MDRDVVEISYSEMEPVLRTLLAFEVNGSVDRICPMKDFARIAHDTPVVRWENGIGFFDMEDVVAVANNPAVVSTDPVTHHVMGMGSREPLIPLHLDGERHRHYRKLIDPLFAPRQVVRYEPSFRKLADGLIDRFIGDGKVELHSQYATPLPTTMFMHLLGAPMEDLDFFIEMKNDILAAPGVTLEERHAAGVISGDRMRARLRQILDDRRASGSNEDDLISRFMTWEIDGARLTDDEILNVMHLFVIAGLDTVTSSIGCLIGWLAQHPAERHRLMADTELIPAAVEELMRYESPVQQGGGRWATADFEVNGIPVKKGDMVALGWATANVDEAAFEDPLTVDFDRPSKKHIAFAAGRHRCLGSHLARLELRVAIDQFHQRMADYSLAPGEEPVYKWEGVRHPSYMPLVFTAR